jgi:RNA polymerase sigma factor (sigma-70 family)
MDWELLAVPGEMLTDSYTMDSKVRGSETYCSTVTRYVRDKDVSGHETVYEPASHLPFDENYLHALKDGNKEAENHLIFHFSRSVKLKLQARLRSPELVLDARQEIFLRLLAYFRSGKTLEHPASLPGFVYTVCHNVALEFLRAHTRHDQVAENAPEPADRAPDPESQAVTTERKQIIWKLLRELTEMDRELLRRVVLEEEDKDVICREFHVNRAYLRVLLYRARTRFKALSSKIASVNRSTVPTIGAA